MKKFFAIASCAAALILIFCAVFGVFAASAEFETPEYGKLKGIVAKVTDMNGDGVLDSGGKIEIKIISPGGVAVLSFSESEFDDIALSSGKNKNVSVGAEAYAVNAVVELEFFGRLSLLSGADISENAVEIKEGVFSAFRKNGGAPAVLPRGNEVYSTFLTVDEGKRAELPSEAASAGLAFYFDGQKGSAEVVYRGVTYTAVKKLGESNAENPLVVTANGEALGFAELRAYAKSFAQGEMLALFGDMDGGGEKQVFELLDFKKARAFAPVSAEFNPVSGEKGEAFSYVLFDSEARSSVPAGRVFSVRRAEGAGLSLVLASKEPGAGYYENVKVYVSASLEEFEYVRGEQITGAQNEGDFVKVTLASGKTVLLPGKSALENREMRADFYYTLGGSTGFQTAHINRAESSWFSSLEAFFAVNEANELAGKSLTAVFGEGGRAVYAEIE